MKEKQIKEKEQLLMERNMINLEKDENILNL
jgi:hypothetical protein